MRIVVTHGIDELVGLEGLRQVSSRRFVSFGVRRIRQGCGECWKLIEQLRPIDVARNMMLRYRASQRVVKFEPLNLIVEYPAFEKSPAIVSHVGVF